MHQSFLEAMSRTAAAVTIVTTDGKAGRAGPADGTRYAGPAAPADGARRAGHAGLAEGARRAGPAGRAGLTVSAMAPVSAAVPSLLVCVNRASAACRAILRNGVFCVNVLRDDQAAIADTFAGRIKTPDGDKFSCAEWTVQSTGAPRLVDALAAFDCRLTQNTVIGTHCVLFGEVADIFMAPTGTPLIHTSRTYATPTPLAPPPTQRAA